MIISRTPYRVSLIGGGSDYPEYYRDAPEGGAVIGLALNQHCYVSVRHLPPYFGHRHRIVYSKVETVGTLDEIEHPLVREALRLAASPDCGLEIHHNGDVPAGSGLGTSSSFAVGLLNALSALRGARLSQDALTTQAIHLERDLVGDAVGAQDQTFAAWGGLRRIEFRGDFPPTVHPLVLPAERERDLLDHLLLIYTGQSRRASDVAADVISKIALNRVHLNRLRRMVDDLEGILVGTGPISEVGLILDEAWMDKRALSPLVSNERVDALYHAAGVAGAYGGKLLGAGGGGFMLFVVAPDRRARVKAAIGPLIEVPVEIDRAGSTIVLYEPNGLGHR